MNRAFVIAQAKLARKEQGIKKGERAVLGDCGSTSRIFKRNIEEKSSYKVVVKHGMFICNTADPLVFDHTWAEVEGIIVDPTVDQFFSDLDIDMVLVTYGIYFAHKDHDGECLANRYCF